MKLINSRVTASDDKRRLISGGSSSFECLYDGAERTSGCAILKRSLSYYDIHNRHI
jgi:hypothetical protein